MLKNPGYFEIAGLICRTEVGNLLTWSEIVKRVKEANITKPIKNWLTVRGSLQHFINKGMIKRSNNLFVEAYEVIRTEP